MKKSLKNILGITFGTILGLSTLTSQAQTTLNDLRSANIINSDNTDSLSVPGRNASYAGLYSTNNGTIQSGDSIEIYTIDTLNSRLKTNSLILLDDSNSIDSADFQELKTDSDVTLFEAKNYANVPEAFTALKEIFKEYQFNNLIQMDTATANGAIITMTDSNTGNVLGTDTIQAGKANFSFDYIGDSTLTANFNITKPNTLGKDTTLTLNKNDTINLGSLIKDYEFTFWGSVKNTWTNNVEPGVNLTILDSASNDTLANIVSNASGLYINNPSVHFTKDTIQARYILSKNGFLTTDTTIQAVTGNVNENLTISPITYDFTILGISNVNNAIITYKQGNDTLTIDTANAGNIETHFTTLNDTEIVSLNVKDPITNAHFDLDSTFTFNQGTNGPLALNLDSMYKIIMNGEVKSNAGTPLNGHVVFVNHYDIADTILNTQSINGTYADTIFTNNDNTTIVDATVDGVVGFNGISNITSITSGINTNDFILDTVQVLKKYYLVGSGQKNVSFNLVDLVADTTLINFTSDENGFYNEQFKSIADSVIAIYNLSASGFEDKTDTVTLFPDPNINQYNPSLNQILHSYEVNIMTEEDANVKIIVDNDTTNYTSDVTGLVNFSFNNFSSPVILKVEGSKINFETKDTSYVASPDQVSNFILPLKEKELNSFFMYGGSNPDSVRITLRPLTYPNDTLVDITTQTMSDSTGSYNKNFQFEDSVFTAFVNARYVGSNGTYAEFNDTLQFEKGSNFYYFSLNSTTGIEEIKNNSIKSKIFPNPVLNNANIIYDPAQGNAQLKIYDVTGKEVYQTSQPANEGNFKVPFANKKTGTYIYEIKTNKGTDKEKFINK